MVNIVGTFPKEKAPLGAIYAQLNPTGAFVEAFYKEEEIQRNDGTTNKCWMFWGNFQTWRGCERSEQAIFAPHIKFLEVK